MSKYEKISLIIALASLAIQIIDLLKQSMKRPNERGFADLTRQAISFLLIFEMSLTPPHVGGSSFISLIIAQVMGAIQRHLFRYVACGGH